jgi:CHAT domain-containing protein
MRLPFEAHTLETEVLRLQQTLLRSTPGSRGAPSSAEQIVQQFGQRLFEALLAGDVRRLYDASAARAAQQGQGLRLRLHLGAPELTALPWEVLYDPLQHDYVCFLPETVLVRYLEVAQPIPPFKVEPPLRVLAMLAAPSDQAPLNSAAEQQRFQEALRSLEQLGLLKVRWVEGQRVRDLHHALLQREWHIFHFIGHGAFDPQRQEGVLALANEQGNSHLLSATDLGRLLAQHPALRLVVLNSCQGATGNRQTLFSSTAAILASKRIPAVLAMQYDISDQAALDFTRGFYSSLAAGLPVDSALTQARTAIRVGATRTLEWITPVLYLRSSTGVLFEVPPAVTRVGLPVSLPLSKPSAGAPPLPPLGAVPPALGGHPALPASSAFLASPSGNAPGGGWAAAVPGSVGLPGQGLPSPVPVAPPLPPTWASSPPGRSTPAFQRPREQPPDRARHARWWVSLIGILGVVGLLVALGVALLTLPPSTSHTPTSAPATATPRGATHLSNVLIGRGDQQGHLTTQTTTFTLADTIDIDYLATTQESSAVALLRLLHSDGSLTATIGPLTLQPGTHSYYYTFVMRETGSFMAQLQYNGVTEATLHYTVT